MFQHDITDGESIHLSNVTKSRREQVKRMAIAVVIAFLLFAGFAMIANAGSDHQGDWQGVHRKTMRKQEHFTGACGSHDRKGVWLEPGCGKW